jgi:hypothetical protein
MFTMRTSHAAAFALLLSISGYARSVTPAVEVTISHLIGYVENSGCSFVRNGSGHDGKAAAQHLRDKYRYGRDNIDTTEQFIDFVAAGSSVSGEPYLVKCGNDAPQRSAIWLREELARYRNGVTSAR